MKPICLVTGVGPGTGQAIVKRFAADYDVAMIARNEERLATLQAETENTHTFVCDVSDSAALCDTISQIRTDLGDPEVIIHNAVGGAFGDFMSITPKTLQKNFEVNTMALLQLGQALVPSMMEAGKGALICTGNTSAFRGKANFAGFAPTKAAQRILAESMARHAGPYGVHIAYVAIDAVISVPWARERFKDQPDDFFCHPVDIADHVWNVAHQPRSAWTFESVIRPFGETW
ncbi:MAG: SDR family NAD(P)-dependent oxidoreductase [Gammaproteobacteria bacterium]|nr:SDR family NAD(P)-dependent oxidoreductase [Gammaproteobacteria bacterium]